MEKRTFDVLRCVAETSAPLKAETIALITGYDTELVNSIISVLFGKGLIDCENKILTAGLNELEKYKVNNAIILAAGMSTRFAPFSYERPKGLTVVKGEVLIERQIRQLKEAGVEEIVLVLGHMMEKFLYLVDKYGVKVVINSEYKYKNTHSSIYFAREYLKNTYVCCADNYFPESVFHEYEYHSLYSVLYMEGKWPGERGVTTDDTGLIVETQRPAIDQWVMNGFAYYNQDFSEKFKNILEEMWDTPGSESLYWEQVYAANVDKLPLYAVKYTDQEVMEFDSVAELEAFDPEFIKYNDLTITKNICDTLKCDIGDIHNIRPLMKGYTNKSFSFTYADGKYIYRTPGTVSSEWINRKSEKLAQEVAKELGVDNSYIYEDENEGWKISKFVDITEDFSFENERHLTMLCESLNRFYSQRRLCGRKMDFICEAKTLLGKLKRLDGETYDVAAGQLRQYEEIDERLKSDQWPICIVHNDLYEDNLLVSGDELYIIDWEYAGDTDIGFDICKIIVKNGVLASDADEWLSFYYNRKPTKEEVIHIIGCAAVSFYYWYIWALYMTKCGNDYADLIMKYKEISDRYREQFRLLAIS